YKEHNQVPEIRHLGVEIPKTRKDQLAIYSCVEVCIVSSSSYLKFLKDINYLSNIFFVELSTRFSNMMKAFSLSVIVKTIVYNCSKGSFSEIEILSPNIFLYSAKISDNFTSFNVIVPSFQLMDVSRFSIFDFINLPL